jgi:hypothetical protein
MVGENMGEKIKTHGETIERTTPDPLEGIVGALLGGIPLIGSVLEPDYRHTIHTDKGDFVGRGKTPEEAKAEAEAKLRKRL